MLKEWLPYAAVSWIHRLLLGAPKWAFIFDVRIEGDGERSNEQTNEIKWGDGDGDGDDNGDDDVSKAWS